MRIILNTEEISFPRSLSEVTLGQRIAFYEQYGRDLDEMLKSILEIKEEDDQQIELMQFQLEKMYRVFAFFTNSTPEAVENSPFIEEITEIYYTALKPLIDDVLPETLQTSFTWKDEEWRLPRPQLKHGSDMSFGEFIDAKQAIQDLIEQGKSPVERLLPLCVIFLRKKGEAYQEAFLYDGSERMELMKELPMDIALQAGFFLNSSMTTARTTSRSSGNPKRRAAANSVRSISRDGDGSTSLNPLQRQRFSISQGRLAIPLTVHELQDVSMY